jgi:beta-1,4-mannosyltransferase
LSQPKTLRILVPLLDSFAGGCPELPAWFTAAQAADGVEVADHSTGVLLRERWDVVYIFWPEWCIRRDSGLATTAFDAAKLLTELSVARMRGAKIVWHANNVVPHESDRLGVVDAFMHAFARLVDQLIACTQTVMEDFVRHYPVLRSADQQVIQLGHYRDFYPDQRLSQAEARGVLGLPPDVKIALSFGMVRSYKNHLPLVRCFREMAATRRDVLLLIAGKPMPESLGERLRYESRQLDNIRLDLRFIPDDEVQLYQRAASVSVVSTSLATTSGSAMVALSFDRPVVLPHRAEYLEWRECLGDRWVHTYEGGIRPSVLERAFQMEQPDGRPALEEHHDWPSASRRLLDVLRELCHGTPVGGHEPVHQ